MFQAIQTKFLGPTNNRGSRYKATCAGGSVTRSADYGVNFEENHKAVAFELLAKMGWDDLYSLEGGCLPSGEYAFVLVRK